MSIKRYMNDLDDMVEHRNGDFVTYDGHAAEVARLNEIISETTKRADRLHGMFNAGLERQGELNEQVQALAAESAIQDFIISAVKELVRDSQGVAGWHLNGAVASWDEVLPELNHSETPATNAILNEVRALSEFKSKVRQLLRMGEAAEDFAVFTNIENALRRSDCLSAVEREFFTREVPDEEYPDEVCEECNLFWGKNPGEYIADFAGELNEVRALAVDDVAMTFHEKGFVAFENSNETGPFIRAELQQIAARIRKGEQL